MKPYLKLMRVHHYIKNILVFSALACSGKLFEINLLLKNIIAFAAFSMAASSIYIINDIRDKDSDAVHPVKCHRPIASGMVSVRKGKILVGLCIAAALALNSIVYTPVSTLLLILFMVLNLFYSFGAKDLPIIDIVILVSGYIIRVMYGAYITQIQISNWLYLTVMAVSFYLALGKRRNELKRNGVKSRRVLLAYPLPFLDKMMYSFLTLAIAFYALWSMDEKTVMHYHNNQYLVFSVPIVMLITIKYSMNIEKDSEGDPVDVLLQDKVLLFLCAFYLAIMAFVLYLI